jgi:hypothetical protein
MEKPTRSLLLVRSSGIYSPRTASAPKSARLQESAAPTSCSGLVPPKESVDFRKRICVDSNSAPEHSAGSRQGACPLIDPAELIMVEAEGVGPQGVELRKTARWLREHIGFKRHSVQRLGVGPQSAIDMAREDVGWPPHEVIRHCIVEKPLGGRLPWDVPVELVVVLQKDKRLTISEEVRWLCRTLEYTVRVNMAYIVCVRVPIGGELRHLLSKVIVTIVRAKERLVASDLRPPEFVSTRLRNDEYDMPEPSTIQAN